MRYSFELRVEQKDLSPLQSPYQYALEKFKQDFNEKAWQKAPFELSRSRAGFEVFQTDFYFLPAGHLQNIEEQMIRLKKLLTDELKESNPDLYAELGHVYYQIVEMTLYIVKGGAVLNKH